MKSPKYPPRSARLVISPTTPAPTDIDKKTALETDRYYRLQ